MKLLFDIGGTTMRVGASRDGMVVDAVERVATPPVFEDGMRQLQTLADTLAIGQEIESVTGGIAGVLTKDKSQLFASPNLVGWERRPLQQEIEKLFNKPVHLENDAALAGLGEATQGAGREHTIVAYVTVSTGLGGALIVHGQIAPRTYSFEPGKIIVHEAKTLEDFVSGAALQKQYGKPVEEITDENVWHEATQHLAGGLHTMTMLWSPEVIVLGGGLIESEKIDLTLLQTECKKRSVVFPELPLLKKAKLGDVGGLTGALLLNR